MTTDLDTWSAAGVRLDPAEVTRDHTRLVGSRCESCGLTAFPALTRCHRCWREVSLLPLSTTGSLYTYSVIHGRNEPYTVGYVDLPENVRVFARISVTDEHRLHPDMPVHLAIWTDPEDTSNVRFTWSPVEGS